MIKPRTIFYLLAIAAAPLTVHAQATRTWISGVGDDANPCSRTAPCRTWAGAMSKTAAGGEIDALDPGPYGPVTINKTLTIDGGGGQVASSLQTAAGNSAFIINAAATDRVIVRNVQLQGAGQGATGFNFIAGASLAIENCTIMNFAGNGVDFHPSATAQLFVTNTSVRNNAGSGILIRPAAGVVAFASIEKTRMEKNQAGLRVEAGGRATAHDCVSTGNNANGYLCFTTGAAAEMNLDNCVASNNGTNGVKSEGATATARVSHSTITNNSNIGLLAASGAALLTYTPVTNRVAGNAGGDGSPTGNITQQ